MKDLFDNVDVRNIVAFIKKNISTFSYNVVICCYCYYLAIQRSVWRDIKFAVFFVCTVEDISTQDGAIGVKFSLRVEQTQGTGTR